MSLLSLLQEIVSSALSSPHPLLVMMSLLLLPKKIVSSALSALHHLVVMMSYAAAILALTDALAPPADEHVVEDNVTDAEGADDERCKLKPPPAGKPGFKGKRVVTAKGRGGKQKACMTAQIPAIVAGLPNSVEPNIAPATCSHYSKCKVAKIQMIQHLGLATQQLRHEMKEKDTALSDVKSLTKKLTKSKEVVGNCVFV